MIILITPTGGRPNQIELCSRWMFSQTYQGEVHWIITDDCVPITTDFFKNKFRDNWTVYLLYPRPQWMQGQNTQARNLSTALSYMKSQFRVEDIEAIFIIEDDDYYKPQYIERMVEHLKGFEAAGEMHTIYYNVFTRTFVENQNEPWASLFQTAISPSALPVLEKCFTVRFIDFEFFSRLKNVNLFRENNLSIGMKGMPGRYGIGAGHTQAYSLHPDPNLDYLKQLIGEQNAMVYSRYYRNNSQSQHTPLFRKSRWQR